MQHGTALWTALGALYAIVLILIVIARMKEKPIPVYDHPTNISTPKEKAIPVHDPPAINLLPGCVHNDDCRDDRACIHHQCQDPCLNVCHENTVCQVKKHIPVCICYPGFVGDAVNSCRKPALPECTRDEECAHDRACMSQRCVDPCLNICVTNAICQVLNHIPACICSPGFSGNPIKGCNETGSVATNTGTGENTQVGKEKTYSVETSNKKTWYAASRFCELRGGYLAVVTSQEENDEILEAIERANPRESSYWIGGTDDDAEGHWKWMPSGQTINGYNNWHKGEPNGQGTENCIYYYTYVSYESDELKWNDAPCSTESSFICEYLQTL